MSPTRIRNGEQPPAPLFAQKRLGDLGRDLAEWSANMRPSE